jgi:membrane-bound acyltransferase YfiQ involved in biofilm formation
MDAGNPNMNTRRQLQIFLIGSMVIIVSLVVFCAALCPTDSYGSQFSARTDCTFTSHAFVPIGNGQSTFFILLFLGLFLTLNKFVISAGFYLSPFRPPRFYT